MRRSLCESCIEWNAVISTAAAGEYLCKTALKEKIYLPFIIFFLTHKKATIVIPTLGN
jgi:hypothetical protein